MRKVGLKPLSSITIFEIIVFTVSELRARLKTLKDHVGRYYHALKKDPKHKATPMQQYALDNVMCLTIHGVEEKGYEMEKITVVEEVDTELQEANFIQHDGELIEIKYESSSKDYGDSNDCESNNSNDNTQIFDGPFSNQENQQNLLQPKKHAKLNSKKMTSDISMMMATELPLQVPVEIEELEEHKICPEALVVWDAFKTLPANKKPEVYLKLNQAVSAFKSAVKRN